MHTRFFLTLIPLPRTINNELGEDDRKGMNYFFCMILLVLFTQPLQAKATLEPFELILSSLQQCYANKTLVGPKFAKCVLAKLNASENPEGYRVFFTEESFDRNIPGPFKLTISNKKGQVFTCTGTTSKVITFDNCTAKKIVPQPNLSITPP